MNPTESFVVKIPDERWTLQDFNKYMRWCEDQGITDKITWYRPKEVGGQRNPTHFFFTNEADAVAFRLAHGI